MQHYYWTDWYMGWGWFLWFGVIFLLISAFGNWGYSYRTHRRIDEQARSRGKNALDILQERFARGEIGLNEYRQMKAEIKSEYVERPKKSA